jgi:adenylate cyclase
MPTDRVERRLAAILVADVVGYSRLMEADEVGTFARLKAVHKEVIDPKITEYRGRIFKTTGDGILAEFSSAVDAVLYAIDVQNAMVAREADRSESQRLQFRIGINLGDIIIDGEDIHGGGVNVAARLEGLAEPDGLAVSGTIYEHITEKVSASFSDAGERSVKNISRPVRVWVWNRGEIAAGQRSPDKRGLHDTGERPSIIILPFENMSGDPEQEYFTDGMVEEINTALARFNQLHVIARSFTFTYKGRPTDIRKISRELGVRYVLEGSVRKAGARVRITGQLIAAETGAHLWADRFDGNLEDIFELQDRITARVVGAIEPKIRAAEIERSRRNRPGNLAAYDLYLRALPHVYAMTPIENTKALELLDEAIELDPGYAPALAHAAWCYQARTSFAWSESEESDADCAIDYARNAIAADRDDAVSLATGAFVLGMVGHDLDSAGIAISRAIELNANDARVLGYAGYVRCFEGDQDTAIRYFEDALRLSPGDPMAFAYKQGLAQSLLLAGKFAEAAHMAAHAVQENPNFGPGSRTLAAACAQSGDTDKARQAVARLLETDPMTSIAYISRRLPFRDDAQFALLLDGLRKAGLPENSVP